MNYVLRLVKGNYELDELGILIFARMFHIHVGIIYQNSFWCTSVENDLSMYEIILALTGLNIYSEMVVLQNISISCDIYFLSYSGDEYVIKPSGDIHKVLNKEESQIVNH